MDPKGLIGRARQIVRERGIAPLSMTLLVLAWSAKDLVWLGITHNTGAELYGVLVAALAVAAGATSLVLLASTGTRTWATVAVLVLWGVIAFGGIAGTVAHIIGPVAGHGPVDLRPRPIAAPLVFTALGLVGGLGLFVGMRSGARRAHKIEKE